MRREGDIGDLLLKLKDIGYVTESSISELGIRTTVAGFVLFINPG